jgi:hypothetical protein
MSEPATLPESFTAKTAFGDFRVRIVGNDSISIGGKNDCVQIYYDSYTNTGKLDRLETEKGGCSLSADDIKGEKTIQMTDLGFTILRQLYPSVKEVTLIDSAKFPCTLPDGSRASMSYKQFFLLLKGKTYYQDRFAAIPELPQEVQALTNFEKNWKDPQRKPESFNFMNPSIQTLLTPIYNASTTWEQFIKKLYEIYNRNVCQIMFPWYLHAYSKIITADITTFWKIDISKRQHISFEIKDAKEIQRYTRKNLVYDPSTFWGGSIYQIDYSNTSTKKTNTSRNTRKNRQKLT